MGGAIRIISLAALTVRPTKLAFLLTCFAYVLIETVREEYEGRREECETQEHDK